ALHELRRKKKCLGALTFPASCPMFLATERRSTTKAALNRPEWGRENRRVVLLGSSIRANHPQGWDAKPWVPEGIARLPKGLVHPGAYSLPPRRPLTAVCFPWQSFCQD